MISRSCYGLRLNPFVTIARRTLSECCHSDISATSLHTVNRVLSLQERVTELSAESERLSQTLDREKKAGHSASAELQKKIDDLSNLVQKRRAERDINEIVQVISDSAYGDVVICSLERVVLIVFNFERT